MLCTPEATGYDRPVLVDPSLLAERTRQGKTM